MDYEYRNIDTDAELLKAARRYWTEEGYSKEDAYSDLANNCYTKWEADRAFNDYYHIHVWSKILMDRLVVAGGLVGIALLACRLVWRLVVN